MRASELEEHEDVQQASSSFDDEGADLSRQRVDDEDQEERQDDQDEQRYDVLLVVFPDEEDEGLHRVDEPVEAGGRTTRETKKRRFESVYTHSRICLGKLLLVLSVFILFYSSDRDNGCFC